MRDREEIPSEFVVIKKESIDIGIVHSEVYWMLNDAVLCSVLFSKRERLYSVTSHVMKVFKYCGMDLS